MSTSTWPARTSTEEAAGGAFPEVRGPGPLVPTHPDEDRSARKLGYASAVLSTALALAYVVAQLFEWAGVLGSAGGPESASTPLGIALLLTPSLLLGSAFLVLMVSLHARVPSARKVWTHAGVAFATAYAALTGLVYFVQLTVVGPRLARGEIVGMEMFVFTPFDSFLYAVDILGYTFMCLALLFAGFALTGDGLERVARRFMLANGLIVPFLVSQMYVHPAIWFASLWALTFPAATLSLALLFRRDVNRNAARAR